MKSISFKLMTIIILSIFSVAFFSCDKKEANIASKEEVSKYLPQGYLEQTIQTVDAINYGLINAPLVEVETIENGVKSIRKEIDYATAEQLTFDYLGIDQSELKTGSVSDENQYLSEQEIEETLNLMSEEMMYYNEQITSLFSVFESEENENGWDKEVVIKDLISQIDSIQYSIINNQILVDWEKTALLSSTTMGKCFVASLDELTKNIDQNITTKGFFKKIWKGVTKVAKAVVRVAFVSAVTVTRTVGFAIFAGINGAINNDNGYLGKAFSGFGCAVAGSVKGFYGGIRNGFKCKSFDFKCMMRDYEDMPCSGKFSY
jgi:hypothetical protein